jgi:ABC-type transport system involved in multi-copper enzyme maturation permease subunit
VDGWGPYAADEDAEPFTRDRPASVPTASVRPRVGANALLWKELYVEKAIGAPSWDTLASFLGVVLCLVLVLLPVILSVGDISGPFVQGLVQILGSGLSGLLLVIVAVSAAGRVSREREKQTLDSLLALPVSPWDILLTKWLGSVLCVRGLWWLLPVIWGLGLAAGALSPFAIVLLAAAWMVSAWFLAALGLFLSAVCRTTLRTTLLTLLVAVLYVVTPSNVAGMYAFASVPGAPAEPEGWLGLFAQATLNPGGAPGIFAFRSADLTGGPEGIGTMTRVLAAIVGLHVYLILIPLLWFATLARLRSEKGRAPRRCAEASVLGRAPIAVSAECHPGP